DQENSHQRLQLSTTVWLQRQHEPPQMKRQPSLVVTSGAERPENGSSFLSTPPPGKGVEASKCGFEVGRSLWKQYQHFQVLLILRKTLAEILVGEWETILHIHQFRLRGGTVNIQTKAFLKDDIKFISYLRKKTQPLADMGTPLSLPEHPLKRTQEQPVTLGRRGPKSNQSPSEEEDPGAASHPQWRGSRSTQTPLEQ
ncbi:hypothetical protein STEG23_011431, partial [Scotinomys teguina]